MVHNNEMLQADQIGLLVTTVVILVSHHSSNNNANHIYLSIKI
jgi:Co/Zn/Cd efflux system component